MLAYQTLRPGERDELAASPPDPPV
jgi:hypothetical protein